MSSPSRKLENAATAAPVSSQGVATGSWSSSSSPSLSAVAATWTATDSPSFSSPTVTGSSSISDNAPLAASLLSAVSPAVSPAVSLTPGPHLPFTFTPSPSLAAGHVDQNNNKKSRPPTAPQRSNGPSLLSQALASARGIPPTSVSNSASQADERYPEQKPVQLNGPSQPVQSKNVPEARTRHAVIDPQNDFLQSTEHGSLTSTGQLRPSEATRTISAPFLTSTTYPTPDSTTSLPIAMPGAVGVSTALADGRDFDFGMGGRGRSLERTEQEIRLRLLDYPKTQSDNVGDTMLPHPASVSDIAPSTDDQSEPVSDSRAQYRAWRVERTVSMGPEKAWSIGTNDIIGHQDGQVEKSITEVLAGVEPTRSRKASHSLRFFKEGLPEEKGRRRESKSVGHQREKALLAKGLQPDIREEKYDENNVFETPTSSPQPIEGEQSPPRVLHVQSPTWGAPTSESVSSEATELDYFGLQTPQKLATEPFKKSSSQEKFASRTGVYGAPNGSTAVSGEDAAQVSRKSSDIAEIGGAVEEGDESSEEKISSAVFLPHQGLNQSPENGNALPEDLKVTPPASRKPHSEGFHPWLVKADEPEAEDEAKPDGLDGGNVNRNREAASHIEEFPRIDDECAIEDEAELPPKSGGLSVESSRPVSQYYEDMAHEHQPAPELPLEAIELIPYKHQVGGHTTIWRFSKRAVCKQLNNRENEFYEKIERYHRDLLPFLPRYIGVLNVTFQKQPRRKSTIKKEDSHILERKIGDQDSQPNGNNEPASLSTRKGLDAPEREEQRYHRRIVSQSLQSSQTPIPTVTFVDNRHILPRSLLRPAVTSSDYIRPASASAALGQQYFRDLHSQMSDHDAVSAARPSLEDRHTNSWGATTVNKRLRNEVFNDAFLKQPIAVHKHRRPASHQRSIPRLSVQRLDRPTSSGNPLPCREDFYDDSRRSDNLNSTNPPILNIHSHSDLGAEPGCLRAESMDHLKDVTGTSAPELETLSDKFEQQRRKRRNSGSKLRRRPEDVMESRGSLKYFEDLDEVEYIRDNETHPGLRTLPHPRNELKQGAELVENGTADSSTFPSNLSSEFPSELPSPTMELKRIPRPVNPKEAQTQHDSRVEYFLLLEDLTAGMKRPCIMDLKMGTRQYGVEANPKKRDSQRRKCAATTSRELGVRVCGLQAWDAKSQTYAFKDKYYGRDLKAGTEFQDALTMFLYDGVDYSSVLRHIPTILQKLNQLEMTIRRLRGYRFYAASLLMFYDADTSNDGYDTAADDSTTDFPTDAEDAWDPRKRQKNKKEIDFKMADFANSVTAGDLAENKPCPPRHPNEPDRGFLRGLATLKKYFLKIQKDVRSELGLGISRRHDEDGNQDEKDEYEEGSVSE